MPQALWGPGNWDEGQLGPVMAPRLSEKHNLGRRDGWFKALRRPNTEGSALEFPSQRDSLKLAVIHKNLKP